jgi:hypothetical protein
MACDRTWRFPNEVVSTAMTAVKNLWKTEWILVEDGASVSASLRASAIGTNFQFFLCYELADVRPDVPTSSGTLGAVVNTTTTGTGRTVTITAPTSMWVRFGYQYNLTASTTEQSAEIGMDLAIHQCVNPVGRRVGEVPPALPAGSNISDAWIFLLGEPRSTAGSPKYKATIIGRGITNFADCRTALVYRTMDDLANPGSWTLLEGGWDTPAGADDERCTAECTPTVTNKMYVQVALAVRRQTAGGAIQGDFDVLLVEIK